MRVFTLAQTLALLIGLGALPAWAQTYRVDALIFMDLRPTSEVSSPVRLPPDGIALDDSNRLAANGIQMLPEAEFALESQWAKLRGSARFRPLLRLSWLQKDPPADNGPALQIQSGEALTLDDGSPISPVSGTLRLLMGRFLHLDADLRYTTPSETGLRQYRLHEKRKMLQNELHHLDSAKLAVLARIQQVAP
ncbi:CsiV family protein [Sinimarinibacterium sp. NLF-5-8]|uniref:CsiV family protein n=1 Tax=Sinimarinibacterium sp. NLF-5-8 TaxID=2698684 RepID=UPI00137BA619|nr:CsiV family protein [Sinimarinibacterium sp. NLF-5-8]QHS09677.1 hypothetical protein GT972_05560 [Sinimarinibacterium sp. NLF-5-8]